MRIGKLFLDSLKKKKRKMVKMVDADNIHERGVFTSFIALSKTFQ